MSMMVLVVILLVAAGLVVFAISSRNRSDKAELNRLRGETREQQEQLRMVSSALLRIQTAEDIRSAQLDAEITLNALTKEIA
jgi:type II secretory pathway pseudopilin PulG